MNWDEWLEEVAALPALHPAWDTIEPAVAALRSIEAIKRARLALDGSLAAVDPWWRERLDSLMKLSGDDAYWAELNELLLPLSQIAEFKISERNLAETRLRAHGEKVNSLPLEKLGLAAFTEAELVGMDEKSLPALEGLPNSLEEYFTLSAITEDSIPDEEARHQRRKKLVGLYDEIHRKYREALTPNLVTRSEGPTETESSSLLETSASEPPGDLIGKNEDKRVEEGLSESDTHKEIASGDVSGTPSESAGADVAKSVSPPQSIGAPNLQGDTLLPPRPESEPARARERERPDIVEPPVRGPVRPAIYPKMAGSCGGREVANFAYGYQIMPSVENGNRFLAALVSADDLCGAYWMSLAMEKGNDTPWLSSNHLAALQASFLVETPHDSIVYDLEDLVTRPSASNNANNALRVATALNCAVLVPEVTGPWLDEVLNEYPTVRSIAEVVREFTHLLVPLDRNLAAAPSPVQPGDYQQLEIEAERWLRKKPNFSWIGCVRAWRALTSKDGDLTRLAQIVRDNRKEHLKACREICGVWLRRPVALRRINHLANIGCEWKQDVIGGNLDHLLHEIATPVDLARRWCDLVERETTSKKMADSDEWNRIAKLRAAVEVLLPALSAELAAKTVERVSMEEACIAHLLSRSVARLCFLLRITQTEPEPCWSEAHYLSRCDGDDLTRALARRLWWLPEVERAGLESSVADGELPVIANAITTSCGAGRSLMSAFDLWLECEDYRFCDDIIAVGLGDAARVRLRESRAASIDSLHGFVQQTINAVEDAVLDGVVLDRRAEFLGRLAEVDPAADPHRTRDPVLRFNPAREKVRLISSDLDSESEGRLAYFRQRWQDLRKRLIDEAGDDADPVIQFVDRAQTQTRVLSECLSDVAEAFDMGGDLREHLKALSWMAPAVGRDELKEFLAFADDSPGTLPEDALERLRDDICGVGEARTKQGSRVPSERRAEVEQAASAWIRLRGRPSEEQHTIADVGEILTFLDITLTDEPPRIESRSNDSLSVFVHASTGDGAQPFWQFGSESRGEFRIVVVWNQINPIRLDGICQEAARDDTAVIVLYAGAQSTEMRRDFGARARRRKDRLVVMDEILFIFLTGERDNRLKALLRCAAPFSGMIPYTPNRRNSVPREMFFGRTGVARQIWDSQGSCVIYGGRQLGKTVVQRKVVDEFENRARRHFAWHFAGDYFHPSDGDTDRLWRNLRDKLFEEGLMAKQSALNIERVPDALRALFKSDPALKIVAMFDEADDFLDFDAHQHFACVKRLRDLMTETDRRFKAVFAGNRKVERFNGIPDQPLAQFGAPIVIGPMEPLDAQHMIRKPLGCLGYRFENDEAALALLSYTNYHPVLIQSVCSALLQRKQQVATPVSPPYWITAGDVAAVCRDGAILEQNRNLLDITIRLEDDYQVIALMMIADQISTKDSFSRGYAIERIIDLGKEHWNPGFENMTTDSLGLRLAEMCDLGLLFQDQKGLFRLRSPNIVGLLSDRDVRRQLEGWRDKPRDGGWIQESHHRWLPSGGGPFRHSMFTRAQESGLIRRDTGVAFVFMSEALGFSFLSDVFRDIVAEEIGCVTETPGVSSPDQVTELLQSVWKREKDRSLVLIRFDAAAALDQCVAAAYSFCESRRSDLRNIRVLFCFGGEATSRWLLHRGHRELERRSRYLAQVRPWDLDGIRRGLNELKYDSESLAHSVLDVTGGWPFLLNELMGAPENDLQLALANLRSRLARPSEPLRHRFRSAIEIQPLSMEERIMFEISGQRDGCSRGDLLELLALDGEASMEGCDIALAVLERLGCLSLSGEVVKPTPAGFWSHFLFSNAGANKER